MGKNKAFPAIKRMRVELDCAFAWNWTVLFDGHNFQWPPSCCYLWGRVTCVGQRYAQSQRKFCKDYVYLVYNSGVTSVRSTVPVNQAQICYDRVQRISFVAQHVHVPASPLIVDRLVTTLNKRVAMALDDTPHHKHLSRAACDDGMAPLPKSHRVCSFLTVRATLTLQMCVTPSSYSCPRTPCRSSLHAPFPPSKPRHLSKISVAPCATLPLRRPAPTLPTRATTPTLLGT